MAVSCVLTVGSFTEGLALSGIENRIFIKSKKPASSLKLTVFSIF
jgi:hypothetical protein